MISPFLEQIQKHVSAWREADYPNIERETRNILNHIKRIGFLHAPQREALETYIYLKEIIGNKPSLDVFTSFFEDEKDLLLGLGVSKEQAFDLVGDKKSIDALKHARFGDVDYANQLYALTMGSGKTILMAVMMMYDFVLSYYHPKDERFAKNALVFAPDTTIIESLKEIKTFDYSKVLPKEYENILLNIKYHYLENTETPLTPIGNYNVIVTNSQKIILRARNVNNNGVQSLFNNTRELEKREKENARLAAIRGLERLMIVVDEAHHSYGKTFEDALRRTRYTINYIHENKPLVGVINLTGTPYVNNKMIADVVYHFGLKEGIERGILKQVRILDYGNVKSEQFVQDVVSTFWSEYGENRLEGRLPKIAFYAPSIEELQKELRPKLERVLAQQNIPIEKILEYHTEAEDGKEEFLKCDTAQSRKQFLLLVGKGTEGWNCRSLVAVALYRKPKSTIFVLQSTTRCLRSIGDNSTIARVFLAQENYGILDRELKKNFATSVQELGGIDQEKIEHELKIEKHKKITVNKVLKEILAVEETNLNNIRIDLKKYRPKEYEMYVSEGGIFLSDEGTAHFQEARETKKKLKDELDLTFYEIVEIVNRYTHFSCMAIEQVLEHNGLTREDVIQKINESPALLPFIIQNILIQAYRYEEKTETVQEELELTKLYPFKISVQKGRNMLVVYREREEEQSGKSKIGFHINPYNFDSTDEKDLFRHLRQALDKDEAISDVYFTGGVVDATHNDFYFEYYSPEKKRIARYFPDFLIETTKGRFIVVEVKGTDELNDYKANKKHYKGSVDELTNEVFAKEVGFQEFQKSNKDFEYHIIFWRFTQRTSEGTIGKTQKSVIFSI